MTTSPLRDFHDPNGIIDYSMDWTAWLEGDTIASSAWSITPSGLTVVGSAYTDTVATARISGGVAGTNYSAVNRITTAGGEQNDRTLFLICREL